MSNKILLADDSITIQKVVNLTFTDEGINVVTVGNGELALKKLTEEHFDLVLADIFMPGRNGYEVCEFVKSDPELRDVPVVLLVGAFEPFDKAEAARVQADGHLTKPFESRILIETVKRMLAESAVRHAQQAAPAPAEPSAGYRGQVVGWDTPTMPVPAQFEEEEPEPPPYDPYASTAKLPPLAQAFKSDEQAQEPEVADDDNRTLGFGAPLPTGALFSRPEIPAEEPAPAVSETFDLSHSLDTTDPHPIEGPPDAVPGFSYEPGGSGPLATQESTPPPEPVEPAPAERPAIGYQQLHPTDSPLDLPDLGVVESHTHEAANVAEVRDPLLETFADVADSTARVDAPAAPGLEVNVHEETAPSMTVAPVEGLVSAWDNSAQPEPEAMAEPEVTPEPVAMAEPEEEASGEVWRTQAFSVQAPAPFGFAEEGETATADAAELPASVPFELPAEAPAEEPRSKATIGLGDLAGLETLRSSNATQRISPDELSAMHTSAAPAEESALGEVPVDWQPEAEIEAEPEEAAEAAAAPEPEAVEAPALEEPEPAVEVEAAAEPAVEEPEPVAVEEPAVEAAVEEPVAAEVAAEPAEVAPEPVAEAAPSNGSGRVSSEVIDEVVRRTMEHLNDDLIREIAWEVVPELAEQLIRKRLGESQ